MDLAKVAGGDARPSTNRTRTCKPVKWTHMRFVVHGKEAELYVGGAAQPCLVVKDLKLGESHGGVALWIGPGTEGYFRDVRITRPGK